jgi:hypothetical protein
MEIIEEENEVDNATRELEDIEEEQEGNETADNEDNEEKNITLNKQRYTLIPRSNIQMHSKYQDYHIERKEGMLTCTYNQCIKGDDSEKWKKAIKEEKDSLYQNKTWIYVER